MQQVEPMVWSPCSRSRQLCRRQDDLLHRRERLSHGLLTLTTHRRGIVHAWRIIFLPCHSCLLSGGEFEMFFRRSITSFSASICNSAPVVVGGHLKWTPQRPCLGNEIALAMAFCHIAPQCILMIGATCRNTALQDSHSDTSLIRVNAHWLPRLPCLDPPCFLNNQPQFPLLVKILFHSGFLFPSS